MPQPFQLLASRFAFLRFHFHRQLLRFHFAARLSPAIFIDISLIVDFAIHYAFHISDFCRRCQPPLMIIFTLADTPFSHFRY
jgi:hypothetical protein